MLGVTVCEFGSIKICYLLIFATVVPRDDPNDNQFNICTPADEILGELRNPYNERGSRPPKHRVPDSKGKSKQVSINELPTPLFTATESNPDINAGDTGCSGEGCSTVALNQDSSNPDMKTSGDTECSGEGCSTPATNSDASNPDINTSSDTECSGEGCSTPVSSPDLTTNNVKRRGFFVEFNA